VTFDTGPTASGFIFTDGYFKNTQYYRSMICFPPFVFYFNVIGRSRVAELLWTRACSFNLLAVC